jgi:hypothetical protein
MIRAMLTDPRFWTLLALGALVSFGFSWLLLRERAAEGAGPSRVAAATLGVVMLGLIAAGFVLFRWGGCVAALAMSLLGWLTVPAAGALARRR